MSPRPRDVRPANDGPVSAESYIAELTRAVQAEPPPRARCLIQEAQDVLRKRVDAALTTGHERESAERRAIDSFPPPQELARRIVHQHWAAHPAVVNAAMTLMCIIDAASIITGLCLLSAGAAAEDATKATVGLIVFMAHCSRFLRSASTTGASWSRTSRTHSSAAQIIPLLRHQRSRRRRKGLQRTKYGPSRRVVMGTGKALGRSRGGRPAQVRLPVHGVSVASHEASLFPSRAWESPQRRASDCSSDGKR